MQRWNFVSADTFASKNVVNMILIKGEHKRDIYTDKINLKGKQILIEIQVHIRIDK